MNLDDVLAPTPLPPSLDKPSPVSKEKAAGQDKPSPVSQQEPTTKTEEIKRKGASKTLAQLSGVYQKNQTQQQQQQLSKPLRPKAGRPKGAPGKRGRPARDEDPREGAERTAFGKQTRQSKASQANHKVEAEKKPAVEASATHRGNGRPGRPRQTNTTANNSSDDENDVDHYQKTNYYDFVSIESRPRRRRAIPQVELVVKSDREPHRITNPLLEMVPANFRKAQNDLQEQMEKERLHRERIATSSRRETSRGNESDSDDGESPRRTKLGYRSVPKVTGTLPVEEFMNSASLVFYRPDTYPISFLARLLGFEVDVPTEDEATDFPQFPTPLPDPKTLPLRKDKVFLTIPPEGKSFRHTPKFNDSKAILGDLDDQRVLDFIDPVYKSFLQHGWDGRRSKTAKRNDSFIAKQKQQEAVRKQVVEMAQQMLGLSKDWTFQDWGSFQSKEQREWRNEKQQQQANEGTIPSSTNPSTKIPEAPINKVDPNTENKTKIPPSSSPSQPSSPSQQQRMNYRNYHGRLWTIEGKETFRYLPKHIFGILASFKGEPVALLKYQFDWYKVPVVTSKENQDVNEKEESELVVVIHGIAHRAAEPVIETNKAEPHAGKDDPKTSNDDERIGGTSMQPEKDSIVQPPEVSPTMNTSEDAKQQLQELPEGENEARQGNLQTQKEEAKSSQPIENKVAVNAAPLPTIKPDDVVKAIMLVLTLEHTRACNVFYGIWETPESAVRLNEACFRMVKLRRNDSLSPSKAAQDDKSDEENKPLQTEKQKILHPMICDLKKCNSRLALLKLKECNGTIEKLNDDSNYSKTHETNHSFISKPERILVEMPTFEKAHSFYEVDKASSSARHSKRGLDPELSSLKIFTGASDATRDISLTLRVKLDASTEEKVEILKLDSETKNYVPVPIPSKPNPKETMNDDCKNIEEEKTGDDTLVEKNQKIVEENEFQEQIPWRMLRCFPIEKMDLPKIESENEILNELKRKQNELIAIEKALEPQVRGILSEAIDERIKYESVESKLKHEEDEKTMMVFEEYLTKKQELEQDLQERREEDMDAVCSICNDGEVTPDNQILFCEACNVAVHQKCYGVEKIPEGDYFCIACRHYERDKVIEKLPESSRFAARENLPPLPINCELCTIKKGAFTRVDTSKSDHPDDAKWVHMTCAKWLGLDFVNKGDPALVEDVTQFKQYFRRKNISCSICKGMRGSYQQCRHPGCENYCHITCALESGMCEVIHGEDVEGNPIHPNPWTIKCPKHSRIEKQPENVSRVQELIKNAKEFPEEVLPPPTMAELGPYNHLTGAQRKVALSLREYEDKYMENILKTKLAGVRCEVCDVIEDIHGRNLCRCDVCGSVVCHSCELFSENPGQKSFRCHGCRFRLENKDDDDEPQCSMCNQKGGLLVKSRSAPMLRKGYWKNNPKEFEKSLFTKARWSHILCAL